MEERLVLVREGDVDDDGGGNGNEARPQRIAQVPCVVGVEVREHERRIDFGNGLELWRGRRG